MQPIFLHCHLIYWRRKLLLLSLGKIVFVNNHHRPPVDDDKQRTLQFLSPMITQGVDRRCCVLNFLRCALSQTTHWIERKFPLSCCSCPQGLSSLLMRPGPAILSAACTRLNILCLRRKVNVRLCGNFMHQFFIRDNFCSNNIIRPAVDTGIIKRRKAGLLNTRSCVNIEPLLRGRRAGGRKRMKRGRDKIRSSSSY